MLLEALFVAGGVALCSLVGVFFFGRNQFLANAETYIVPGAVGVFLALVLLEMIPETLAANATWGGSLIGVGFLLFHIISYELHRYFHHHEDDRDCSRRGAATLVLIGDTIHNLADGIVLGAAFLIDPTLGILTGIGLAIHEIPQEIVEFGILLRGGYSKIEAAWLNLLSASSIFIGTFLTIVLASTAEQYVWIITGIAAGNLLYIAASDLLPRVHTTLKTYSSFWLTVTAMATGFILMSTVLSYAHEMFGQEYKHDQQESHLETH